MRWMTRALWHSGWLSLTGFCQKEDHLLPGCGWPQVTDTLGSESADKGEEGRGLLHKCPRQTCKPRAIKTVSRVVLMGQVKYLVQFRTHTWSCRHFGYCYCIIIIYHCICLKILPIPPPVTLNTVRILTSGVSWKLTPSTVQNDSLVYKPSFNFRAELRRSETAIVLV